MLLQPPTESDQWLLALFQSVSLSCLNHRQQIYPTQARMYLQPVEPGHTSVNATVIAPRYSDQLISSLHDFAPHKASLQLLLTVKLHM